VAMNCFSFCLSWNIFISPSIMNSSFVDKVTSSYFLLALKIPNSMPSLLSRSLLRILLLFWWICFYRWLGASPCSF
jgi:hypothetical protein